MLAIDEKLRENKKNKKLENKIVETNILWSIKWLSKELWIGRLQRGKDHFRFLLFSFVRIACVFILHGGDTISNITDAMCELGCTRMYRMEYFVEQLTMGTYIHTSAIGEKVEAIWRASEFQLLAEPVTRRIYLRSTVAVLPLSQIRDSSGNSACFVASAFLFYLNENRIKLQITR